MVRLGAFFAQINRRIQPDPMVLACLLTVFVAGVAVLLPQNQQLQETHLSQRALLINCFEERPQLVKRNSPRDKFLQIGRELLVRKHRFCTEKI